MDEESGVPGLEFGSEGGIYLGLRCDGVPLKDIAKLCGDSASLALLKVLFLFVNGDGV